MAFTFQINNDVTWNREERLLKKAQENLPEILKTDIQPVAITEIIEDEHGLNGYSAVVSEKKISDLAKYGLGREFQIR